MSISLFISYIKMIVRSQMEYRGAFLIGAVGQIIGYGANYLVIWLLLQKFQVINGWGWSEIAFLYSLNLLTYAIGASFTYSPMVSLEQIIIRGDFDKYITKPLSPFMCYLANLFNIGYIAHIFISLSVLIWSITKIGVEWTLHKVMYLFLVLISGSFLQAAVFVFIGALSFVLLRVGYVFSIYFKIKEFISYPISIYGIFLQIVLTWIIPLAMINYYPSIHLLNINDKYNNFIFAILPLIIGPLVFYLSYKLWMKGVDRYQGAGG